MTDNKQPEALRLAEQYDYGDPAAHSNMWKAAVCNALRRQHARIAELEAELEAVGAGGVQALSAAPAVPNGDELRRIARSARTSASDDASPTEYVLAGWKAAMLAASPTPPAEQQAPSAAAADTVVLEAALRAIHQSIDLIGEPDTDRLRLVRRVLRGAVVVAEDSKAPQPEQPATTEAVTPKAGATTGAALGAEQATPKAAPGEVSDTQHSQFLSDVLTAAGLITHGKQCKALGERLADMVMRLRAAPQQEAQEPVGWTTSITWRPNTRLQSEQVIKITREAQPKYGYTTPIYTAPQPAPAPLSDDVVRDAARWRMAVLIGNEVMLHPEKRTQAAAVKAYMDATHSGLDLTGAVDAAIAAQGGKA